MTPVEMLAATGGRAVHAERLPREVHIVTDTRALAAGETFLALRGERFDGHRFTAEARAKGAAAVIVDDAAAAPPGIAAIVVPDTKKAYLSLAATARNALRARVVAITGSTGKTTTKELLAQMLRTCGGGNIASTLANENNEIGVSKLFLSVPDDVDVVVVECGARHFGDIEPLVAIARPDVAVLTNIGDAHLEIMGSPERLAATKWSIFSRGAQAVLNKDDLTSRERASSLKRPPRWFGVRAPGERVDLQASHVTVLRGRDELVVSDAGVARTYPVHCALPGEHNRANVAAACAAAIALGCDEARVAAAIEGLALPEGRYERARIGDVEVIFDAYNASMAGTLATLEAFASERAARRIAVLASMAELGDGSPSMHEHVGAAAVRAGLAALLVGGRHAADLERGARAEGIAADRVIRFEENADAVQWLCRNARAGDVVLLKGSRMYHLEEIVEGLRGCTT